MGRFPCWVTALNRTIVRQIVSEMSSDAGSDEYSDACANRAVVSPGHSPVKKVDLFVFHARFGHAHESLLKAKEKPVAVKLTGTLGECKLCTLANGIRTDRQTNIVFF